MISLLIRLSLVDQVAPDDLLVRDQDRVVAALRVVDVDAEAVGREQLDGEHLGARDALLDLLRQLLLQLPLPRVRVRYGLPGHKKWAPRAHFAKPVKCGRSRIAKAPPYRGAATSGARFARPWSPPASPP